MLLAVTCFPVATGHHELPVDLVRPGGDKGVVIATAGYYNMYMYRYNVAV